MRLTTSVADPYSRTYQLFDQMRIKRKRKESTSRNIVSYVLYSIKCSKSYGCYFTYHCNLKGKMIVRSYIERLETGPMNTSGSNTCVALRIFFTTVTKSFFSGL